MNIYVVNNDSNYNRKYLLLSEKSIVLCMYEAQMNARLNDEGSVPEMRTWTILLIESGLKWCIHLSRSPFLNFSKQFGNNLENFFSHFLTVSRVWLEGRSVLSSAFVYCNTFSFSFFLYYCEVIMYPPFVFLHSIHLFNVRPDFLDRPHK